MVVEMRAKARDCASQERARRATRRMRTGEVVSSTERMRRPTRIARSSISSPSGGWALP